MLLVEHHMGLVMSLSDQVVVLNFGRVIADGPPDEVRNNPDVTEAYLGTAALMAPILERTRSRPFTANRRSCTGSTFGRGRRHDRVLGANGAGKTTTLRAICGMVRSEGEIAFAGKRLDRRATEDIAALGVAHVPEGRGTFVGLTVEENLRLGGYTRLRKRAANIERMYGYFPFLAERRPQQARRPFRRRAADAGDRAGLDDGAAAALLDEPSFGLAPRWSQDIFTILERIKEEEASAPAGRAECQSRAGSGRSRLPARDRLRRRVGSRRRLADDTRCGALISGY